MLINKYQILLLLLATTSISYAADNMRCGTKLVSIGDSKAEVLLKCGEPMLQETIAFKEQTEYGELAQKYPLLLKHGLLKKNSDGVVIGGRKSTVTLPVDQWTYNLGKGRFLRMLLFEGGKLVAIESGDRT